MTNLLCGTRAPALFWKRFLANLKSHGTFGWELALDEFQEEQEDVENSERVDKQR